MRVQSRRAVALDNAAADKIDQMRMDRASGGAEQPRLEAGIQPFDDSFDPIDRGILRIGCRGYHCGAECDQRAEPRWRAADLSAIFPAPLGRSASKPNR